MGNTCKPISMYDKIHYNKKKTFYLVKVKKKNKYFFKIFIFIYLAIPDANS